MKLWMIAIYMAFIVPSAGFAQDVAESALEDIDPYKDESYDPAVIIFTEAEKLGYIIEKIHNMRVGATAMASSNDEDVLTLGDAIEAAIHDEGADAIRKYHASVRQMMKGNIEWTNESSMLLTIHEIRMLSRHMEWKSMRSHLVSLDRFSTEHYPIWNEMRVESWLVQAETMLYLRPEGEEKNRAIEGLIAKVRLAQKTNEDLEYDFTISDRIIDIEEGHLPETAMLALDETRDSLEERKEGDKGFFGKLTKKLKFW